MHQIIVTRSSLLHQVHSFPKMWHILMGGFVFKVWTPLDGWQKRCKAVPYILGSTKFIWYEVITFLPAFGCFL